MDNIILFNSNIENSISKFNIDSFPLTKDELEIKFRSLIEGYIELPTFDELEFLKYFYDTLLAYKEVELLCSKIPKSDKLVGKSRDKFDFIEKCKPCNGKGKLLVYYTLYNYDRFDFIPIEIIGLYKKVCKLCKGSGKLTKNNKLVECNSCKESNLIISDFSNLPISREEFRSIFYEGIKLSKWVHCNTCNGLGEVEYKPINPVISKEMFKKLNK